MNRDLPFPPKLDFGALPGIHPFHRAQTPYTARFASPGSYFEDEEAATRGSAAATHTRLGKYGVRATPARG